MHSRLLRNGGGLATVARALTPGGRLATGVRGLASGDQRGTTAMRELLDRALTKVNEHGWTQQAIVAAAEEAQLPPMAYSIGKPVDLVSHFMDRALDTTCCEAEDQLHELDTATDKLRLLCRIRLRQTGRVVRRWPEAAALLAQPQNVPLAMRQLNALASQLWYLAGDASTRGDWYLKRSALAAAYVASELYMCEDRSPNFQATWDFLDRRVQGVQEAVDAGASAKAIGEQVSRNLLNILASHGYVPR
ncbi:Ubiquinone biosynthesis protein coq9, mitochondrial [Coemansia biformis]|uniref:Ubiquinone biosynthesis protein n=1 Tax=Coemansia biformis TaxID=1286918 RepID=A0A9W8CXN3_9FUNG|nr:Ubiquinone biosynthesis protein coq9, mitochondrial [Coemansia biformis]